MSVDTGTGRHDVERGSYQRRMRTAKKRARIEVMTAVSRSSCFIVLSRENFNRKSEDADC